MAWASAFIEVRTASCEHQCICGEVIGRGDQYKREAIPPWAGYTDGTWLVIRKCYYCMGAAA